MGRKRGPSAHTREQSELSTSISIDLKREIFSYWVEKMGKKRAVMDKKREARIGWAISTYGMEACREAIDGCSSSPWHMGKNPGNKRYDDISLIFRDAEHVEMFLEHAANGAKKSVKERWVNG